MCFTPLFAMRAECTDLSWMSKREDFNGSAIDNGFCHVPVTVQIYVFAKRGIRYVCYFFKILSDWNITQKYQNLCLRFH